MRRVKTSPERCSQKRRWSCKKNAKKFLAKRKWLKQHAYTCNVCGFVHLTSYKKVG